MIADLKRRAGAELERAQERLELLGVVEAFADSIARDVLRCQGDGKHGWNEEHERDDLSESAAEHLKRGDHVGAAALCMFLWNLDLQKIKAASVPSPGATE